jgi:hypothetical protein
MGYWDISPDKNDGYPFLRDLAVAVVPGDPDADAVAAALRLLT